MTVDRPKRKFSLGPRPKLPEPLVVPGSDEWVEAVARRVRLLANEPTFNRIDLQNSNLTCWAMEMALNATLHGTKRPDYLVSTPRLIGELLSKLHPTARSGNYGGARFFYLHDWPSNEVLFMSSDREGDPRAHALIVNVQ